MSVSEWIEGARAGLSTILASPTEITAYTAAGIAAVLIVVSSFVKLMIPLRLLAIGSNIGFVIFGALHHSWLTFLLELTLLPINVYRALEMARLTRRVAAVSASSHLTGVWLKPYMRSRQLQAGDVLFRKGDLAEELYLLSDGKIALEEIDSHVEPGRIFGEIAFFSPDKRRTVTARCIEDCTVLSIGSDMVRQLYFQNPAFGFELVGLIAGRLSADVERLERQLAAAKPQG